MTDVELAWAAGFFDGEGTVRITKPLERNWGSLIVSISNTDLQSLEWFHDRWGGYLKATVVGEGRKPAWQWVIASHVAVHFLTAIRPYVVRDAVKAKIDFGVEYQSQKRANAGRLNDEEREAYREVQWNAYWWMAVLNRRGIDRGPNAGQHSKGGKK